MVLPYLLFGSISVLAGTVIYYFLPYSLISNNASLLLQIFFFILLGLIFGLALLSMNLRGMIEKILIVGLLFWEKQSTRNLIRKNLIAHKKTNQLTSIIYALSLGCIIFIIVSASLEIEMISNYSVIQGVDVQVQIDNYQNLDNQCIEGCITPDLFDPVLKAYKDHIKSYGYQTRSALDNIYDSYRHYVVLQQFL